MPALCGLDRLSCKISASSILCQVTLRSSTSYCLLGALAIGLCSFASARAQNIPAVPAPTCVEGCGSGRSSSSTPTWHHESAAERERRAEAKREKKAQKDAANKAKEDAKARQKQQDEEARQEMERARERQAEAERQRIVDAERQRKLAIEAQKLQSAFDNAKPAALSGLKGVDGTPVTGSAGGGLGLKGVDDGAPAGGQAGWTATVTDPKVAPMARRLASIVPPLPISEKEVALDWKKVYLNDDRLMDATDTVVAAWEMTGVLGERLSGPVGALIIGGKTLIAGENGAYLHLVTKEKDYDAALAYLKNPAQAQSFARLVQKVREGKPLPATADPAMVKAARAITDPKLGDTGKMVWDAMTSKEALGAMVRKATIEVGATLLPSTKILLKNEAERKVMFDAVRLERTQARKMLELADTTVKQQAQLITVIRHADQLSADLYKVDKAAKLASDVADGHISDAWSESSNAVADHFMGKEAKGREY
jgi:hypothetical protein